MPATTSEDVRSALIGAWRLVGWREVRSDGTIDYPLGPDAEGQLMYARSGRMSAQLVRPGQERFASDDWRQATMEERSAAWPNYFGYFGTFRVDDERQAVVHEIEGGWFPNLERTEQLRHYRFDDGRLNLAADTPWGHVEIVWERVQSPVPEPSPNH
jgi:hypothetical protein